MTCHPSRRRLEQIPIGGCRAMSRIVIALYLSVHGLGAAVADDTTSPGVPAAAPQVTHAEAMDRWIDLTWTSAMVPAGGFTVMVQQEGQAFAVTEQVKPDARSASVYAGGLSSPPAVLTVRVAALDAGNRPGPWSPAISVPMAAPRDIEAEVRRRFGYWERDSTYHADDPVYPVVYSEEQKQAQRVAAKTMFANLMAVAARTDGPRHFTIPPGVYRVGPGQMLLKQVSGFTIHAPQVEVIVDAEKSGPAFTFDECSQVTLTGRAQGGDAQARSQDAPALVIDSQQFPMSVARILAVEAKARTLDVEILPGYHAELPDDERMIAYDVHGRMLNIQQMGWKGVVPLGGRTFRLTSTALRHPVIQERILVPGNLLALHSNPHHSLRTHSVFANHQCRDMTFESIRVYNGGGAPADHGTAGATIFRDWVLIPRSGTNRLPIATGLGQFSKDGGTFVFEDCAFGPHLDDGINLLSGMSVVGRIIGGAELVITGGQRPTPGSILAFHDYTSWEPCGEARVVASEPINDVATLSQVNAFAKRNRTRENARQAYRTVLDRPVAPPPFAMVIHSDHRADAIVVRGCLFRDQLAQIMLLQGAKSGRIENNLLLRSAGGGVSAQFSQYWWEGPMPAHFLIRNNVFRDNPTPAAVNGFAGNAAVAVYAGTNHPTTARLLHDFRIEGNTIINPSVYGIVVRNADDVVIRHNRIINPGAQELDGMFNGRPIADLYAAICLDAVSHTVVTDNEITFQSPRCQRAVLMEPNCDAATVRVGNNREIPIRP